MQDTIHVINLVDRFLHFYKESQKVDDVKEKFAIWKEQYGFAAVPPGEEGEEVAWTFFKNVYSEYENALPSIESFAPDTVLVQDILKEIKEVLDYRASMEFTVLYFVGFFENNAFLAPLEDGSLALCLPIENQNSEDRYRITLAHELTHLVHGKMLGVGGNWIRPLSFLILQEGLAMKMSQAFTGSLEELDCLTLDRNWYNECLDLKKEIVGGMLSYLTDDNHETLFRFTMGEGVTKHSREAYFLAWLLFEKCLKEGMTLKQLATISVEESKEFVTEQSALLCHELDE